MALTRFDGPANMRLDAGLLAAAEAGEPGWRVYDWDGPWVTLGRFQTPERDLLPGCPVPWVLRPTGGRAVLHGHDVTVGLAVPLTVVAASGEDPARLGRSVRRAYRAVAEPLIAALRACGVPAILGERTRWAGPKAARSADCFAAVSAADIVDERTGQKVCGCALRLTGRAVLAQASIPARRPLIDPGLVYRYPAPVSWVRLDGESFAGELDRVLRLA
jgi:lipoate-protein ligase A